jgi:hypothetical protein
MKVKTIKSIEFLNSIIPKESELTVYPFNVFGQEKKLFYQVREGHYKDYVLDANDCELVPSEKSYSEKDWNEMENYYLAEIEKERNAKNRAIGLLAGVTQQLVKKNKEIENLNFYVSALTIGLTASSEAIQVLKEKA